MSEKHLLIEPNVNPDEIQSIIKDVLMLDEMPPDKKIEISVEFMVVPKKMNISISKK